MEQTGKDADCPVGAVLEVAKLRESSFGRDRWSSTDEERTNAQTDRDRDWIGGDGECPDHSVERDAGVKDLKQWE